MNLNLNTIGLVLVLTGTLSLMGCHSDSDRAKPPVSPNPVIHKPPVVIPPVAPDVTGQITFSDEGSGFKRQFVPDPDLNSITFSANGNDLLTSVYIFKNDTNYLSFIFDANFKIFQGSFWLDDLIFTCFASLGVSCTNTLHIVLNEAQHKLLVNLASVDLTPQDSGAYDLLLQMMGIDPSIKSLKPLANGSITINYDPNWFVMKKNRFPSKDLGGSINVNGSTYSVNTLGYENQNKDGTYFSQSFKSSSNNGLSVALVTTESGSYSVTVKTDIDHNYSCYPNCHVTSVISNGVQKISIDSQFHKYDKNSNYMGIYPIQIEIVNPVVSGLVNILTDKENMQFQPINYSLSAKNNNGIYYFKGAEKIINNHISNQTFNITTENGIVTNLEFNGYDYADNSSRYFACSLKSELPCTGITLDPDGKTFRMNQTKLSGGVILNGSLKHAGA